MIKKAKHIAPLSNDQWLTEHFEKIIDKYAGRYILIGNGRILFTDKDGTPGQILRKAKRQFPKVTPLFFRVPRPKEFVCAL